MVHSLNVKIFARFEIILSARVQIMPILFMIKI